MHLVESFSAEVRNGGMGLFEPVCTLLVETHRLQAFYMQSCPWLHKKILKCASLEEKWSVKERLPWVKTTLKIKACYDFFFKSHRCLDEGN